MKRISAIVCAILLIGTGCAKKNVSTPVPDVNPQDNVRLEASINAGNSTSQNGSIAISEITVSAPAWAVLYESIGAGVPGQIVNYTHLTYGLNTNVMLESGQTTPGAYSFFVLIHEDSGENGVFEFPTADLPRADVQASPVTLTIEEPSGKDVKDNAQVTIDGDVTIIDDEVEIVQ